MATPSTPCAGKARRSPPTTEAELLAAPLSDSGIPTRAARPLGAAGVESVGDLVSFRHEKIETITGIGPRLAADIRQALADRGFISQHGDG
jgi:DNA-directed RNA polymerase alpha subunit